jgi:protein tyrosine/serine phosphatase
MMITNKYIIKPNVLEKLRDAIKRLLVENDSNNFVPTNPCNNFPNVKIKNFGQIDKCFFRGAQPKKADYLSLAVIGIETVIDLRDTPKSYEKSLVEALQMRYINIPMSDTEYPKVENIETFLKLINDPSIGVFYVHCAGGRHRTGVVGAVYRFTKYGWDFDRVYQEMRNYDFYTRWGHSVLKDFVFDYAEKIKIERIASTKTS